MIEDHKGIKREKIDEDGKLNEKFTEDEKILN